LQPGYLRAYHPLMARRTKRNKNTVEDRVLRAAMDLAATEGWGTVTTEAVARRAKLRPEQVAERHGSRRAIVAALAARADRAMIAGEAADPALPWRDRLFEVLMRRFEALAPYRPGLKSVLNEAPRRPCESALGARGVGRAMGKAVEAAGFAPRSPKGLAAGLLAGAVYVGVLRRFVEDDSPDLAPTMAALDRRLRQAESALAWFGRLTEPAPERRPA